MRDIINKSIEDEEVKDIFSIIKKENGRIKKQHNVFAFMKKAGRSK